MTGNLCDLFQTQLMEAEINLTERGESMGCHKQGLQTGCLKPQPSNL